MMVEAHSCTSFISKPLERPKRINFPFISKMLVPLILLILRSNNSIRRPLLSESLNIGSTTSLRISCEIPFCRNAAFIL